MSEIIDIEYMIKDAVSRVQEKQDNESFLKEQDKPSLAKLAYALRHPETWPDGFVWKFSNCEHCAMGLARDLWFADKDFGTSSQMVSLMANKLSIPYEDADRIFMKSPRILGIIPRSLDSVTPEMIAKQLDKVVARE